MDGNASRASVIGVLRVMCLDADPAPCVAALAEYSRSCLVGRAKGDSDRLRDNAEVDEDAWRGLPCSWLNVDSLLGLPVSSNRFSSLSPRVLVATLDMALAPPYTQSCW
jgi:hypothetical protein